jgi:hypothetical protein
MYSGCHDNHRDARLHKFRHHVLIPEGQSPMEKDSHVGADQSVYRYLVALKFSEQEIARMSMDTRLFHDLGFYGDTAEDLIRVLESKFGVDFSNFRIDRYFPPEFEGKNKFEAFILNLATPIESRLIRDRDLYAPLTLGMINRWIRDGRWSA